MKGNEYINYNSHVYKQERIYSQYFSPFDNIKKGTKELRERKLLLLISISEYKNKHRIGNNSPYQNAI